MDFGKVPFKKEKGRLQIAKSDFQKMLRRWAVTELAKRGARTRFHYEKQIEETFENKELLDNIHRVDEWVEYVMYWHSENLVTWQEYYDFADDVFYLYSAKLSEWDMDIASALELAECVGIVHEVI